MVRHMFKAFENRESAKRFVRQNGGRLLDPMHSRDDRIEYMTVKECHDVNTARYPCIVVWNEFD